MSKPTKIDLHARTNAHFLATVPVVDLSTDPASVVDLTGATAKSQARQPGDLSGSPTIGVSNVTSNIEGCWIFDPTGGLVQVRINKTTLAAIVVTAPGELDLYYDLQITLASGVIIVPIAGRFHLQWGPTQ